MDEIIQQLYREVGKKVRYYRNKEEMSTAELANRCGIDPSYLSQIENGQTEITIVDLYKLAGHLDLESPETLLNDAINKYYPLIKLNYEKGE